MRRGVLGNVTYQTSHIIELATPPSTRCSNKMPLSFCDSSWNCQASKPVAMTGSVDNAATKKL